VRRPLGTITDLGDGRLRIRVPAGFDRKTGQRLRPSQTIRGTRRDAERVMAEMLMRVGKTTPATVTLEQFLEEVWLPTKAHLRRRTVDGYQSKIDSCITPHIGHLPLKAVSSYVVERWITELTQEGKSAQTVRHARSVLRCAMRAAVRWGHIDIDPTEGVSLPEVDYRPKILTEPQMAEYLIAFEGHVLEAFVILAISAGLRRSENAALEWSDIDFTEGTVTIRRGMHQRRGDVWYEEPKSKKSRRRLALPDGALARLRGLRGVGAVHTFGGGPLPPDTISRLYREHVASCGLPYVPLRNLRNSHGTFLYESGEDLAHISDRLGHGDTTITDKQYVQRRAEVVDRTTVATIERLFASHLVPTTREDTDGNPPVTQDEPTEKVSRSQSRMAR
jgi:integrase